MCSNRSATCSASVGSVGARGGAAGGQGQRLSGEERGEENEPRARLGTVHTLPLSLPRIPAPDQTVTCDRTALPLTVPPAVMPQVGSHETHDPRWWLLWPARTARKSRVFDLDGRRFLPRLPGLGLPSRTGLCRPFPTSRGCRWPRVWCLWTPLWRQTPWRSSPASQATSMVTPLLLHADNRPCA